MLVSLKKIALLMHTTERTVKEEVIIRDDESVVLIQIKADNSVIQTMNLGETNEYITVFRCGTTSDAINQFDLVLDIFL